MKKAKQDKCFRVVWAIYVYSDTPLGAARNAWRIQQDPESTATFFEVHKFPGNGRFTTVDVATGETVK